VDQATQPATDDEQLVAEFQRSGDPEVYRQIVERYQARVFHLALSIMGFDCRAEAEDITQEIFLRVFQRLAGFRHESQFSTWLYRVAYNEAADAKTRARYRLPHVSVEHKGLASGEDPSVTLVKAERSRMLHECMDRLPDLYRSVLNLHYWLGYSTEEIGGALGAPVGTVKSYLFRARAQLARCLCEKGWDT
jgi:RNA polymerase sigma-70 factor (ECF subfamily)